MSFVGDIMKSFDKSKDLSVARQVKSTALQKRLQGNISDYDKLKGDTSAAFTDFKSKFGASEPGVQAFGQQELGELNKVYDTGAGSLQNELERLRMEREGAREAGLNRGFEFARGAMNRSNLLGDTAGTSSYDRATLTKAASDLAIQSLLERNAQERGDFGYLTNLRQGAIGQRGGLEDMLNRRVFIPTDIQSNTLNTQNQALNQMMGLNNQNMIYAPYEKKSGISAWADSLGALESGAQTAMSAYGGSGGNVSSMFSGAGGGSGSGGGGM